MALIKCKECGHDISDKATSCPNCGCPVCFSMEQQQEANQPMYTTFGQKSDRSSKKGLITVIAVFVAIIVCGCIRRVDNHNIGEQETIINKDGLYGFVNKKGEEVIPCRYDYARSFSEGLARVRKNGLYGFVNKKGEEVIPCRYYYVGDFSEGLAAVRKGRLWGFVNKNGEEVIPCRYDVADDFSEGWAWVKKDGLYGFVNKKGEEVIPCRYDWAMSFSEGLALVKIADKWGYVDKKGE